MTKEKTYDYLSRLTKEQFKEFLDDEKRSVQTIKGINGKEYLLNHTTNFKFLVGEDYNYVFDKRNGFFARWGESVNNDPDYSPIGGEILDIEITTSCTGIGGKLCSFCYKSNTPNGKNMSFDSFKNIIDKLGDQLTQVAFGADSKGITNKDLFKMAKYCRDKGVIPNITIAEVSDGIAIKLNEVMGAVAVSRYDNKNICYDSVKKLTDQGMNQVNIHYMISEETYDGCIETLKDIKNDKRLEKLNCIVLLSLKQKGRGVSFTPLSKEKYNYIVNYCLENKINFGMDSCGAKKFLDCVKGHKNYKYFNTIAEPCESTCFSQYINVDSEFYPCSFCEQVEGWDNGINVEEIDNYLESVWNSKRVVDFRTNLINNKDNCHGCRECPIYKI